MNKLNVLLQRFDFNCFSIGSNFLQHYFFFNFLLPSNKQIVNRFLIFHFSQFGLNNHFFQLCFLKALHINRLCLREHRFLLFSLIGSVVSECFC